MDKIDYNIRTLIRCTSETKNMYNQNNNNLQIIIQIMIIITIGKSSNMLKG